MTTLTTPQPITFHAPHKTPVARPKVEQRVWSVAEIQALLDSGEITVATSLPDSSALDWNLKA